MQYIKLVFESLCRALIRFFDNRSIRNTDVEWYRMELDKRSAETQMLINHLVQPQIKVAEPVDDQEFQPINNNKYKSWESKRKELEQESYRKAMALRTEAEIALNRKKTTTELENELLNG